MAGEGQELGRRQLLIAKEDHQMAEPGAADRRDRLVVEPRRQIDPEDLRPDRARKRANLD
jgi:hypothetical protein